MVTDLTAVQLTVIDGPDVEELKQGLFERKQLEFVLTPAGAGSRDYVVIVNMIEHDTDQNFNLEGEVVMIDRMCQGSGRMSFMGHYNVVKKIGQLTTRTS